MEGQSREQYNVVFLLVAGLNWPYGNYKLKTKSIIGCCHGKMKEEALECNSGTGDSLKALATKRGPGEKKEWPVKSEEVIAGPAGGLLSEWALGPGTGEFLPSNGPGELALGPGPSEFPLRPGPKESPSRFELPLVLTRCGPGEWFFLGAWLHQLEQKGAKI